MNYKLLPKYLLLPFSELYGFVATMRNRLFDWGILKQEQFDIPIVVVGNLAVGGTGKTPHTEFLINELRNIYNIGVISRGYKRKTKGFLLATPHSTPYDIGDEPYQIYNKFGGQIPVAVCEKRSNGIKELLYINPNINLILLDDAFQHRYVKPSVSILLTEFSRPIFYDQMLPFGNLREPLQGLNRADFIVVTKCPNEIKPMEYRIFNNKLKPFPFQHLSFSRYTYGQLLPVFPNKAIHIPLLDWLDNDDVIYAISGIGNPKPFINHLKSFYAKVKASTYPDHHDFDQRDLETIRKRFNTFKGNRKYIITTEKDAVRLANNPHFPPDIMPYIFYLPITVEFTNDGDMPPFIDALVNSIESNK